MLRANSRLHQLLGTEGVAVLEHVARSVERILPHVDKVQWTEGAYKEGGAVWTSSNRKEIRITIGVHFGDQKSARSLTGRVRRRSVGSTNNTLDAREHDLCRRISKHISSTLSLVNAAKSDDNINHSAINAIRNSFDETVIAGHLESHHSLNMPVRSALASLHTLSEQTYENKALVFGCLLDPTKSSDRSKSLFPQPFLSAKKYKALSDGFRTAYVISSQGSVVNFVDLEKISAPPLTERNFFPEWSAPMARASRSTRCGVVLTRQGDILIFDEGSLRFTYRYGHWRYWNHTHVVNLLKDRARAQRVPRQQLGKVVGSIYRTALDVSFRRSGGLFVILHNKNSLYEIVREGDAIGDNDRNPIDAEFDSVVRSHKMQSLPRAVAVELASLDGAVVLANSGEILAYGAVLQPKKRGNLRGSEGSRTKAAIGCSNYGMAIKISSDGDITVYHDGHEFFKI